MDYHAMRAALEWQMDLGATESITDAPINRFEAPELKPTAKEPNAPSAKITPARPSPPDGVALAGELARGAGSLPELEAAIGLFELCELKRGARNTVFADGFAGADVMIIGEAPGRDEDIQGKPFVGRAGHLLDKMFAAIGLDRAATTPENAIYTTNILPWRPPQNRDPEPDEIAMMVPFIRRHIELAQPKLVVLMGNIACQAMLDKKGITRLRGQWTQTQDLPTMPMFHPAYLLRNAEKKRDAWADLLAIRAKLDDLT